LAGRIFLSGPAIFLLHPIGYCLGWLHRSPSSSRLLLPWLTCCNGRSIWFARGRVVLCNRLTVGCLCDVTCLAVGAWFLHRSSHVDLRGTDRGAYFEIARYKQLLHTSSRSHTTCTFIRSYTHTHTHLLSTGRPCWQRRELIGCQFKILRGACPVVLLTPDGREREGEGGQKSHKSYITHVTTSLYGRHPTA